MKHVWEWYGIAVAFLIGLLVVLLIAFKVCAGLGADPLSRMLNGPTVGFLLAAIGLLAVVCVILSGKRPWEPDLKLAGKFLLLGGAVGLLFIGCVLWIFWHSGRGTNAAQTIVLSVQTLVLAITAGFVVWYAWEAKRAADAGEEHVEATLLGRAGVLVNDPMTVKEFLEEHDKDGDEPSGESWERLDEKWFVIQVTNQGGSTAANVRLCAKWMDGSPAAPGEQTGRMRSACECVRYLQCMATTPDKIEDLEKKEVGTWQEWQLRGDESRFMLMRKPPSDACDKEWDDKHALGLVWWGPGYLHWSTNIMVQHPKTKGGKWGCGWERARPRRGDKWKEFWPRQECGPLHPPE